MSVVVSDTSPPHYLILCGAVEVLPQLFRQVERDAVRQQRERGRRKIQRGDLEP